MQLSDIFLNLILVGNQSILNFFCSFVFFFCLFVCCCFFCFTFFFFYLKLFLLGFVICNQTLISQMRKTHAQSRGLRTSRFLRDFKKRACGNSRCQLKKKWNCQWCSQKTHLKFQCVLVFDLGIYTKEMSHNFAEFIEGE